METKDNTPLTAEERNILARCWDAARSYQAGEHSEWHGGRENEKPDFSDWVKTQNSLTTTLQKEIELLKDMIQKRDESIKNHGLLWAEAEGRAMRFESQSNKLKEALERIADALDSPEFPAESLEFLAWSVANEALKQHNEKGGKGE